MDKNLVLKAIQLCEAEMYSDGLHPDQIDRLGQAINTIYDLVPNKYFEKIESICEKLSKEYKCDNSESHSVEKE